MCLKGKALEVWMQKKETNQAPSTPAAFMDMLETAFTDKRMRRFIQKNMFRDIRQREDEGIEQFLTRFTALASEAGITCEHDLMEQWLAAIHPSVAHAIAAEEASSLISLAEKSAVAYGNIRMAQMRSSARTGSYGGEATIARMFAQPQRPEEKKTQALEDVMAETMKMMGMMMKQMESNERRGWGQRDRERSRSPSPRRGDRKPMSCFKCGARNHLADYCQYENRVCFRCKREGHDIKDCTTPEAEMADGAKEGFKGQPEQGN